MSDEGLEHLEERARLIRQVTEDVRQLLPLLNDLEERFTQYKQDLLLALDIIGIYDA